ncbi:hypothetical protein NC651_027895 [Populus alba x Populus x berolinensis]|nr:hypothetical protein NC651_027895 [Populus alba x Populus x berolinensis]
MSCVLVNAKVVYALKRPVSKIPKSPDPKLSCKHSTALKGQTTAAGFAFTAGFAFSSRKTFLDHYLLLSDLDIKLTLLESPNFTARSVSTPQQLCTALLQIFLRSNTKNKTKVDLSSKNLYQGLLCCQFSSDCSIKLLPERVLTVDWSEFHNNNNKYLFQLEHELYLLAQRLAAKISILEISTAVFSTLTSKFRRLGGQ